MKACNFTWDYGLNQKTNKLRIRIQSITMVKTIYRIQHTKKNRSRKNGGKDGKALYNLMNNAVYGKTMRNLRNRIGVKLLTTKKTLKWISKPSYMSHKLFNNDWVAIVKSKVTLMLNKPACGGMRILELRKMSMYEFHYEYIKINMATTQDNHSQTLIVQCM